MDAVARTRIDGLALTAVAVASATAVAYWLMSAQGDTPRVWFLGLLLLGVLLAGYRAVGRAPWRRVALGISAVVLLSTSAPALASVGLPIMVAGALAVLACLRSTDSIGRS